MSSPKVVSCFKSHLTCDDMLPPRHPELRRLAHGDNFTDEELERPSTLRSRSVRLHSSIACRLQDTNMEYWKDWKDADSHCNSLSLGDRPSHSWSTCFPISNIWGRLESAGLSASLQRPMWQSLSSLLILWRLGSSTIETTWAPWWPLAYLGTLNKALFAKPKGDVRSRPFNQMYSVSWRDVKMPKENFNGSSCVISSPPG